MGFESSRAARRRLAAIAATNQRVQEALSASTFPGFFGETQYTAELDSIPTPAAIDVAPPTDLNDHLDLLAHDIIATPGAGGALLVAYAAQARALSMVVEAARRAAGAPLPPSVVRAAEVALNTPTALSSLPMI